MKRNSWRGRNTDTNAFNADAGSLYASLSCPMDAHPAPPCHAHSFSLCTVCAPFFGWALFAGCLIEMFAGVATVQHGVAEKGGRGEGESCRGATCGGFCAPHQSIRNCWLVGILFLRLPLHIATMLQANSPFSLHRLAQPFCRVSA